MKSEVRRKGEVRARRAEVTKGECGYGVCGQKAGENRFGRVGQM